MTFYRRGLVQRGGSQVKHDRVVAWARRRWMTCGGLKAMAARACGHQRVRRSRVAPAEGLACVTSSRSTVPTAHPPQTSSPFIASVYAQACTVAGSAWRAKTTACTGVCCSLFEFDLGWFKSDFLQILQLNCILR